MAKNSKSDGAGGDGDRFAKTSEISNEVQYDPTTGDGLATVIVQAIADQTGKDREAYRESPLHEYVEIGAIETLLFGTQPDQSTGPAARKVTFRYRSFQVTVRADGMIQFANSDSNSAKKS